MTLLRLIALSTAMLSVSACSHRWANFDDIFRPTTTGKAVRVVQGFSHPHPTPKQSQPAPRKIAVHTTHQRINTTQCHDNDDWYLDGYRVGKSFRTQKAQMLQQRMNYCQLTQLPNQFKRNWEQGYNIGSDQGSLKDKSRKI